MNQQELEKRIDFKKRGREAAKQLVDLIHEDTVDQGSFYQEGFWEELIHRFSDFIAKPVKQEVEPMSEMQAQEFGKTTMTYGKHQGKRIDDIEISYLEWLSTGNEFQRDLRRYLASKRIRRERGDA